MMQNEKKLRSAILTFYAEGCNLTHAGKLSEAVDTFTLAIENNVHRAEAYFRRGVCHYRLGNFRKTANDMDAATVLGCKDAQMWSRYALQQSDNTDEPLSGSL